MSAPGAGVASSPPSPSAAPFFARAAATSTPDLNEIALLLGDLAAGNGDALARLRPALHRIVAAPTFSRAVKTLVVQALLLLDDPRIGEGGRGTPLLVKVRKLVAAALAADASGNGEPAGPDSPTTGTTTSFSPGLLLAPGVDRSLLEEFVAEAREQLELAEAALLVVDNNPDDRQALEALFRALHSIKGTSAFLGVEQATEVAHHAESLLAGVRAGTAVCTPEWSNLVFRCIDMLDAMLVAMERVASGEPAIVPDGYRELLAELRAGPAAEAGPALVSRSSGQFRRLLSSDLSVRVRAVDLERLVGVVRELVLTQSMISRDPLLRSPSAADLGRKIGFAERLTFELDDLVTELRTVSFSTVLQKVARLARDAAYQSGKSIELVMEGDSVPLERVMADALADPLIHMVRNAIDHGFEPSTERIAAGKPAVGTLRIGALRQGTEVVIELSDDGRGIDPKRLVRVAVERGLISADARLSDTEAFGLLFRPGFSTASVVTDRSGRGVGMDVVRTNVDSIGGTIEIASRVGQGTTFTIRLPFRR